MTRVAIHGAAGRMGRNLLAACLDDPETTLAAAFEHRDHPALGQDAGLLAGREHAGVQLTADRAGATFDVVVDFSGPQAALALIEDCVAREAAIVIGTTGFDAAQKAEIGGRAASIPIVMAPNMGIGINLVFGLVQAAARALGDDYDAEILERHHRHKVDAPSGTALRLGEVVAIGRDRSLQECMAAPRQGQVGPRQQGEIGFAVSRGGDIVGEHSVLFAGDGELIEVTHKASSRRVFALGAMRAAKWVHGRRPGLYDMQDVLNLSWA